MFRNRYLVIASGALVSALSIYLALHGIDLGAVGDAFAHAYVMPWVPLGLAFFLVGYLLRGVRCWFLVRQTNELSVVTATSVLLVGYGANNILPARLGEFVRAGMLAERTSMPVVQALGITFIERVLDGLSLLFILVIATTSSTVPSWIDDVVKLATVVFGLATVSIAIAAIWPASVITVAGRIGGLVSPAWRDRYVRLATNVNAAAACTRDPRKAVLLVAFSVLIWCFEAACYVLFLPIFGLPLSLEAGVVTMCVTGFGLLLPSSPGFIGPFHYFASQTLIAYGVTQSNALAYATSVHLGFYVPLTVLGAGAMVWYGVELSSTVALARDQSTRHAPRADASRRSR